MKDMTLGNMIWIVVGIVIAIAGTAVMVTNIAQPWLQKTKDDSNDYKNSVPAITITYAAPEQGLKIVA